ncbi:hypothetical protein [Mucilaginibacter antarcticus]|uniref:DUF4251 domain-containing protein n=1 Tax=Mucilaginibacter antarcticus TaxID=1855725 RepID=A0ABW5XRM8_9SPHI
MKKLALCVWFICLSSICFAQANLISYEDLKFLLHNNLAQADTFLVAKRYATIKKDDKKKTATYKATIPGGTFVSLGMRADGRRVFMELETNDANQYNLINNSIAPYLNTEGSVGDVQIYTIKNLCSIYITVNDSRPYNPLKRTYLMQIVSDKNVHSFDGN